MLPKEEIHFFNDIAYYHVPFTHCPTGEDLRTALKCHCKPSDNFDWKGYSCKTQLCPQIGRILLIRYPFRHFQVLRDKQHGKARGLGTGSELINREIGLMSLILCFMSCYGHVVSLYLVDRLGIYNIKHRARKQCVEGQKMAPLMKRKFLGSRLLQMLSSPLTVVAYPMLLSLSMYFFFFFFDTTATEGGNSRAFLSSRLRPDLALYLS